MGRLYHPTQIARPPAVRSLSPDTMSRTTVLAAVLFAAPVFAQSPDKWETPPALKGLKFRNIGPAAGGRASRACGVPGDPLTYYVATAGGGVWKSSDGGQSFQPIFDDQPTASIGSVAVAPSDPNVVYVGAGEANIRGNVAAGNGITSPPTPARRGGTSGRPSARSAP
jgi:hypothetical protein